MLSLKQAFAYQNYLKELWESANRYLQSQRNVTVTTVKHLRTKSYAEAEDEVEVNPKDSTIDVTVDKMVRFLEDTTEEISKLSNAINIAKTKSDSSLDTMISVNCYKRKVLDTLSYMANIRPTSSKGRATDYRFNNDGDQVSYNYPTETSTVIDFDRNDIRKKVSGLRKEVETISEEIDHVMLDTKVDYEPKYDYMLGFEDVLEQFE